MLLSYSDEDLGPKLEGRLDSRDHLCYHYFFAHQTFVHVLSMFCPCFVHVLSMFSNSEFVVSDVEAA